MHVAGYGRQDPDRDGAHGRRQGPRAPLVDRPRERARRAALNATIRAPAPHPWIAVFVQLPLIVNPPRKLGGRRSERRGEGQVLKLARRYAASAGSPIG